MRAGVKIKNFLPLLLPSTVLSQDDGLFFDSLMGSSTDLVEKLYGSYSNDYEEDLHANCTMKVSEYDVENYISPEEYKNCKNLHNQMAEATAKLENIEKEEEGLTLEQKRAYNAADTYESFSRMRCVDPIGYGIRRNSFHFTKDIHFRTVNGGDCTETKHRYQCRFTCPPGSKKYELENPRNDPSKIVFAWNMHGFNCQCVKRRCFYSTSVQTDNRFWSTPNHLRIIHCGNKNDHLNGVLLKHKGHVHYEPRDGTDVGAFPVADAPAPTTTQEPTTTTTEKVFFIVFFKIR